jgi:hypothetical protein
MNHELGQCLWIEILKWKIMKSIFLFIAMSFLCGGCAYFEGFSTVEFTYFNLSSNEIWIIEIEGLPSDATPGRLTPSRDEGRLSAAGSALPGGIRVPAKFKIVWKENGRRGWPGGLENPLSVPPGITHEAEFYRDELGIPAKLTGGKVRFSYLGNDKWRVKFFAKETEN